jgi:hypothetical protein
MKSSPSPKAHGPRSDCSRRPSHHTVVQETPTPMESRILHQRYALNLDGPLFRSQRELLQCLFDTARRQEPILLGTEETELLEGVLNLTDNLADQAADRYGIDCLLPTQE